MIIEKLKSEGTYVGYDKKIGYLYSLNNTFYTVGKDGVKRV